MITRGVAILRWRPQIQSFKRERAGIQFVNLLLNPQELEIMEYMLSAKLINDDIFFTFGNNK